jgi:GNAT superfamily N-acetyltransferase
VSVGRVIEKLNSGHPIDLFECGQPDLDRWLKRHALQNQHANAAQTYVGLEQGAVIGFYSLSVAQVEYADSPERLRKGLARHPVPVMLLARLAVDRNFQRRGIGRSLLRDAVLRTLQAADIAGIRALAVHAKDDAVKRFYEDFDFRPSPTDPLHLFVLLKDLRSLLEHSVCPPPPPRGDGGGPFHGSG